MAFLDDVADLIAGEVSHIGLSSDGSTEVSGGGYTHRVPSYGAASGGTASLNSPLEFDGPANQEVTHIIFKRSGAAWIYRAVGTARSFNSDGRINVSSANITPTLA